MGRMDPRVYYNFKKFAKTVQKAKESIECVVIGTLSARRWSQFEKVKMTFEEKNEIPKENQMFGVPIIWLKGHQGAQIQYKN